MRRAASRALCTAGSSSATMTPPHNRAETPTAMITATTGLEADDRRGGSAPESGKGILIVAPHLAHGPLWPANESATCVVLPQWGQVNVMGIFGHLHEGASDRRQGECFDRIKNE